ncbi:MAG: thiolase domain-containing protein [Dehalococcoidia bacterium]|nr:thiolase domain-containing protein [Dehalococcoidia bacterium]
MVRVLGGYQTDFARNWTREGKHLVAPMKEAIQEGLRIVQLEPQDIGTIHVGNFGAELYAMQGHLGSLAIEADPRFRGKPTGRHEAACASGSIAMLAGLSDIEAGHYQTAMVLGVEQMKTVNSVQGGDYLGTASWYEREAKGKDYPFPRLFGKIGAEYVRRYDMAKSTYEQYQAYLSDLMYRNARKNPKAQTRDWAMNEKHALTEDKFNLRISEEIKLSDCSQVTDGAAVVFLASEEYAREYARKHNIDLNTIPHILGWGHTTAPMMLADKVAESLNYDRPLPHSREAVKQAYNRAGIEGPEQLDVYEFHDCFTTTAYASVDVIGLTRPGENYKAIEGGWLEMDGKLPINPSGGLIGGGHPVGATGIRQMLDVYKQTTEKADDYQVAIKNRKALMVNIGGSGTTNCAFVVGFPESTTTKAKTRR